MVKISPSEKLYGTVVKGAPASTIPNLTGMQLPSGSRYISEARRAYWGPQSTMSKKNFAKSVALPDAKLSGANRNRGPAASLAASKGTPSKGATPSKGGTPMGFSGGQKSTSRAPASSMKGGATSGRSSGLSGTRSHNAGSPGKKMACGGRVKKKR